MLLSQQLITIFLVTLAHGDDCPIFFSPPDVVVEYGDSVFVNCSTNIPHKGIRWEGLKTEMEMTEDLSSWAVNEMTDWEIQPSCVLNETECSQNLEITIYKTPDRVSIRKVENIMIEGIQYKLQCDVVNVAPVQNLTVKWYKGEILVHHENFTDTIKTPVNKSSIYQITPELADDGAQYRCEAELNLGLKGPQPLRKVTSESLNTTVHDMSTLLQFNPERVVVEYGSSVSVNCSIDVLHDGIGWEANEGSVPMTSTQNHTIWKVSNLRRWDSKPQCYILINRIQRERYLSITVYKTPDRVSISTVDLKGVMIEGSQYKLQCDVVNVAPVQNLTVKWYKGEILVHRETFNDTIKSPLNKTSTLSITVDRTDDGVQYRCAAELELGAEGPQPPPNVTSEGLNITVHYKPHIHFCNHWEPKIWSNLRSYPQSIYSIVGNPSPHIAWSRGSSSLNASRSLDKYDSGEYKITASNEQGASSCVINITVNYPPKINCSESLQMQEKARLKLPCSFDGVPGPNISLYKDGKQIPLPYFPGWNHSGLYNLSASNKHGSVHHLLKLNILYAPVFDTMPRNAKVVAGGNITRHCSSSGNPEPHMWLSFKSTNISTGERHVTLSIQKATSADSGEYICSATNKVGQIKTTFSLEIIENGSSRYIFAVYILLVLLALLIILLCLFFWRKKKSSGHYQIQQDQELKLLSNGGPK